MKSGEDRDGHRHDARTDKARPRHASGQPGHPAGGRYRVGGRSPGSRVVTSAWPSRRLAPSVTRYDRRSPLTVAGAAPASIRGSHRLPVLASRTTCPRRTSTRAPSQLRRPRSTGDIRNSLYEVPPSSSDRANLSDSQHRERCGNQPVLSQSGVSRLAGPLAMAICVEGAREILAPRSWKIPSRA